MRLVLDTHVLIWLINGDQTLSSNVKQAIDEASAGGETLVPVVCFWEVGMLHSKRRLHLEKPPLEWTRDALNRPGIQVAPFIPEIAISSTQLPGNFHQDPADRVIVATGRALDATVVTRDRRIIRYGTEGHVSVMRA